jgi:succinate dehydrogenase / fumarate reductase membrane anchor subunit|tara:strand:+ start:2276 stop:2605 length:330 start_codon:yes stop_codon:yes gene_type:complete
MINATKKWVFLKVSSIILIPLLLWFMINLISIYDKSFEEVLTFFATQPSKLLVSLLMIVAFFYSALSISEIFEDYIHDQKTKYVASVLLYLFAITIPLLTIVIILTLSL